MTNNTNYKLIAERLGIFGNIIFPVVGSQAADLAKIIEELLKLCSADELGGNLTFKLSGLQNRLGKMFEVYHHDYLDKLDDQARVDRYIKNLTKFSTLVIELQDVLQKLQETQAGHKREVREWLDTIEGITQSVLTRYEKMQAEFPEGYL